jgi:probable DNA metabolism protein
MQPDEDVRVVTLASAIDFEGFRRACRALWADQVGPDRVSWSTAQDPEADLFAAAANAAAASTAPPVSVPSGFMPLCESAILHRDPSRFALLYRLLWRLQIEPALRHDTLDPDWAAVYEMAQAVRADMHRMRTSVRFRAIEDGAAGGPLHVAWFEPEHHIVEATASFFAQRDAAMRWAILTPERSVRWDGARLLAGAPARRDQAPAADAGDEAWLGYCRSLFDPARGELSELPKRDGAAPCEMPSGSAAIRSTTRVRRGPNDPRGRRPTQPQPGAGQPATPGGGAPATLPALREALERCRECPIGEHATQAVPGEGLRHARLMFVGEQPGDQEDLQGRPFVGPAGQLFNRALAQLGIERRDVYITNAVKHFKFELRGKRRIHKTPAQQEAAACLHWLESEIELADPGVLVALGATAARQLMGTAVAVTRQRGQWLKRADGRRVLITLHPSALLRMEPEDKEAAYDAWLRDLRKAADGASR